MTTTPARVFLSIGRAYTPEQRMLLRQVEAAAEANSLQLIRLSSDEPYYESPLSVIGSMLQSSYGAIIVAYSRSVHYSGAEYPASTSEIALPARHLTTVWNQIESALALHYRLPIMTLVEKHVHAEGLLSPRHPQYHVVRFHLDACQDGLPPAVLAEMTAFADRVHRFHAAKKRQHLDVATNMSEEIGEERQSCANTSNFSKTPEA